MTRASRIVVVAALLLVIGIVVVALSLPRKPDLSGQWVLDAAKSDFGPLPATKSRTDTITLKGSHLTVTRAQVGATGAATSITVDCVIGGGDCTNTYAQEEGRLQARAAWHGDVLAIDSVLDSAGLHVNVRDLYTLSPDHKQLTIKRHLALPDGEANQTFILHKQ